MVAEARDGGALLDGRLGADGARDGAADDRLGDHLALHAAPGAGGDGRTSRAGGGGAGAVPARLRDVEDLPQQRQGADEAKTLGPMRDAVSIVRGVLGGEAFEYDGEHLERVGAGRSTRTPRAPREVPPVYVAATAPKMQALAGEIADGCLTPSITTPAFVRYTRENVAADIDIGCTVVASIHETDRERRPRGRARDRGDVPREQVPEHQRRRRTRCSSSRRSSMDELRPVAEAMERGGRLAAKAEVTDSLLDRCKPIAGTPEDCIAAIEEYRDAGCTHVMLELWGDGRHEQIRLFGEHVLPHFRGGG